MQELTGYLPVIIGFALLAWFMIRVAVRAITWARRGSPAARFIGWAMLLLGAGMNPHPPPQEQVELADRHKKGKKGSESGDPKD